MKLLTKYENGNELLLDEETGKYYLDACIENLIDVTEDFMPKENPDETKEDKWRTDAYLEGK